MKAAASIRTRLSAWYAGAFALLLSIFALAAYAFLEHTTQQRIDEYLAETAGAVAGAMEFERVSAASRSTRSSRMCSRNSGSSDIAVTVLDRETNGCRWSISVARRRSTPPRTHAAQQLPDLRTILARTKPGDADDVRDGHRR